jgi:methylmalonyl-CoA mutase N-terminal domain/subunit
VASFPVLTQTLTPVPLRQKSFFRNREVPTRPVKVIPSTERFSKIMDRPYYQSEDLAGFDPERDLGDPGQYPFTRGVRPTMYRGRLWTMRQYSGMGDAEQSNRRYQFLLAQGGNGLSVAFDLPTQIGYDSDSPWATGEVGKAGVAIDSIEDLERLFAGIPLDAVSISMTINATAAILLAMYVAAARRSGCLETQLTGTVQNDILKEYIARGAYIYPVQHSMRLVADLCTWSGQYLPSWNPISVSGYHLREAGATAVQEVAFTLANGLAYLGALREAGIDTERSAARFSFFFAAHNDFFEEVAKFRAARRLWARLLKERFGIRDPLALSLRFHTQTAGSTLTAQQPENNLARTAVQALSAVLGGTQSLHVNGYDEALVLPSEECARLALRTQQILARESGVAQTVDPFAGSYYVESLTTAIEQEAREYLDRIDALGGMAAAIERGWVQREIEDAAYRQQRAIDSGETVVVGVNRFTGRGEDAAEPAARSFADTVEREQIERVRALRARRDPRRWQAALDQVIEQARSSDNVMPALLEAVESSATVGEIAGSMGKVFGEYQPISS